VFDSEDFDLDFDFDFSNANDDLDDDEDDDDDDASTHTPIASPRSPPYLPDPSLDGHSKVEYDCQYGDPRIIDTLDRFEWAQGAQRLSAASLLIPPTRSPLSPLTLPVSAAELDFYGLVPSPLASTEPKPDPNAYVFTAEYNDQPMEDSFDTLCDNDMTVVGESFDILGPESVAVDDLEFGWESSQKLEPVPPSPATPPSPVIGGPGFKLQRRYNPGISVPIPPVCDMWKTRGTKRSEPDDSPEMEMQPLMSPRERSASLQPPQTPVPTSAGFALPPLLTPFMPPLFNLSLYTPTTTTPPPPPSAGPELKLKLEMPSSPSPPMMESPVEDNPDMMDTSPDAHIDVTLDDGKPVYSMAWGSYTLTRRIDTDLVNLSVLKLVAQSEIPSSPTDAPLDSWVPLQEVRRLISKGDLDLPSYIVDNFLRDQLTDLFPLPMPQVSAVPLLPSLDEQETDKSPDPKTESIAKEKMVGATSNIMNRPIRQSRRASIAAAKLENKPVVPLNETTSRLRSASRASQPEKLPPRPPSPSPPSTRSRRKRSSTIATHPVPPRSPTHIRTRSGRRISLAS
jgi:hypothetical protein